ncbi:uncharacterized protein LOC118721433 isoform X3 [Pipistrellus kuhlii]|uniref:uncharacterized protein LOC118721433 isoform X3 n=1 Tax=Pipistrellus kuhlii TaxID=59472 RepID=UPI001E26FC8F|nr:uncharacterized protein LOC118721433 isoform X3 [Pipistrellus kuhlii]
MKSPEPERAGARAEAEAEVVAGEVRRALPGSLRSAEAGVRVGDSAPAPAEPGDPGPRAEALCGREGPERTAPESTDGHLGLDWMDAPSPSPPSVIHHPLVHRSRLQHHGQLPGRCGPGASPGGWTRGRRDHTKDFLLDQECESSCEWNWEERMGEKEGGRDEAWQCQKRWEPHGRRNRVGESLSMGSSCRHPPGGPWATYKVLEESELGVSGRRSASSCGTGSVTDTPSSCSLSPNPDQALTGSQLVQAK